MLRSKSPHEPLPSCSGARSRALERKGLPMVSRTLRGSRRLTHRPTWMRRSRRPRVLRILAERTIRLDPRISHGHRKGAPNAIVRGLIAANTIVATACATRDRAKNLHELSRSRGLALGELERDVTRTEPERRKEMRARAHRPRQGRRRVRLLRGDGGRHAVDQDRFPQTPGATPIGVAIERSIVYPRGARWLSGSTHANRRFNREAEEMGIYVGAPMVSRCHERAGPRGTLAAGGGAALRGRRRSGCHQAPARQSWQRWLCFA